jgi:hypothetical protein
MLARRRIVAVSQAVPPAGSLDQRIFKGSQSGLSPGDDENTLRSCLHSLVLTPPRGSRRHGDAAGCRGMLQFLRIIYITATTCAARTHSTNQNLKSKQTRSQRDGRRTWKRVSSGIFLFGIEADSSKIPTSSARGSRFGKRGGFAGLTSGARIVYPPTRRGTPNETDN